MSTHDPLLDDQPDANEPSEHPAGEPPPEDKKKHRNPWVWISGALALIAVGLLIWGATSQADLENAEDDVTELRTQVNDESAEAEAAKDVADELAQDLGATSEDLAASEDQLAQAEDAAADAQQDAEAAKQQAEKAGNATEQAQAQAKEAQAEAKAAESKAEVAAECARSYVGAFGALFEGESVKEQAPAVRDQLAGISDQCSAALSSG